MGLGDSEPARMDAVVSSWRRTSRAGCTGEGLRVWTGSGLEQELAGQLIIGSSNLPCMAVASENL
jgi:hypothetical protein